MKIEISKSSRNRNEILIAVKSILNRGYNWLEDDNNIYIVGNFSQTEIDKLSDIDSQSEFQESRDNDKYTEVITLITERSALAELRDSAQAKQAFKDRAQSRIGEINSRLAVILV